MRASVIIVNWNGKHFLKECLDSVLAQDFKGFEVILVDNASTDGSAAFVKEHYPKVRLIASPENTGFAHANNIAAKVAEGEYLVFLNPDTAVGKDWLRHLLAPLERDPTIGATGSKLLFHDDHAHINSVGTFVSVFGFTGSLGDGQPASEFSREQELFAPSGGGAAIRKKLYSEIGGIYEPYFMYEDDVDLGWRVWNAGLRVVLVPNAIVYHKYSREQKPHKYYYMARNRLWCFWKNSRKRELIRLFPLGIAFSCALTTAFLLTLQFSKAGSTLKGMADGLLHLPRREPARNGLAARHFTGPTASRSIAFQKLGKHFRA